MQNRAPIKTVCLALKTPALLYGEKLAHTCEKNESQPSDLDTLPGIQLENRWIQGKATRKKIRALRGNHRLGPCNVQGETGHLSVPAIWRVLGLCCQINVVNGCVHGGESCLLVYTMDLLFIMEKYTFYTNWCPWVLQSCFGRGSHDTSPLDQSQISATSRLERSTYQHI